MATTVTKNGRIIHITVLDADWSWNEATKGYPDRDDLEISSIQFNPSAATDQCVMREGDAALGPIFFDVTCADTTDQRVKYFDGLRLRPCFDVSASTISSASTASLILILK